MVACKTGFLYQRNYDFSPRLGKPSNYTLRFLLKNPSGWQTHGSTDAISCLMLSISCTVAHKYSIKTDQGCFFTFRTAGRN